MRTPRLLALAVVLTACSQTVATTTTTTALPGSTVSPSSSVTTTATDAPAAPTSSTTVTSTTRPLADLPDSPVAAGESVCDLYDAPTVVGEVSDTALIEVSGIAASRTHEGVVWAVNDSGDGPVVYAIDDGDTITTLTLDGVFPIDWEDLSIGPGPDGSDHLFVADIGDNLGFRPWISIFRVAEPNPGSGSDLSATPDEIELIYPDLDSVDAEAIAVDPVTGAVIVIPKSRDAVGVYRAARDTLDGRSTMERIATLDLGAEITAAAFSPSGDRLVLRGYKTIWAWPRTALDLADVLGEAPCEAPSPTERQGEALTVRTDNGLLTISEGGRPDINLVAATG